LPANISNVSGTSPIMVANGSTTPLISINSDTIYQWRLKQNKGARAYDTTSSHNLRLKKLERDTVHWNAWHDNQNLSYSGGKINITGGTGILLPLVSALDTARGLVKGANNLGPSYFLNAWEIGLFHGVLHRILQQIHGDGWVEKRFRE